ncbi:Aflatoxin B1 aldehyde reductase member [Seminavis robusta]|uniref:Aflatoxin B1 aldehyde reductase member n=1 Tax=Seminavis robusta TaxID=568900 RepID=A0A9N8DJR3_9STRA|nr:Aflatoxin B1 aldehyde reductase member [Seminavis robusta]|eukprot:Sro191_g082190.1 Aflatoxin B1 aldehyde reductase member (363) ;mRNA; f:37016-38104
MRTPIPRIYLGSMTFAWSGQTSSVVDESVALAMVQKFLQFQETSDNDKVPLLDTARVYAGGKTELMVGAVLDKLSVSDSKSSIVVGSKANPALPGGLSRKGIQEQLATSLDAMALSSLGEYYLHQPDTEHSLLESLQCIDELIHQQDKPIASLGMSNYHAVEMERAFTLCQEHNLTPPTVYQGLYNPLNRLVEDELLPVLHKHNCQFVAYNPLAAGLLTGKHLQQGNGVVPAGRFKDNPNYLPRFYTDANFQAVQLIDQACQKEGISMVEASYRWLLRHSQLRPQIDGILIGASSLTQLDENLDSCTAAATQGPLSDQLLEAFDQAWELTQKEGAFPYWRSYSADFPNRESLHPGASYTVKK